MDQERQKPAPTPQTPPPDGCDDAAADLAAERDKAARIGSSAADIIAAALSSDPKKFLEANKQPSGQ